MRRILMVFAICIFLIFLCECSVMAEKNFTSAVVNNPDSADRLNLRAEPRQSAESLGKYYNGVQVQILENVDNDWVRVRIGKVGISEGYMMKQYLSSGVESLVNSAMPTYISLSSSWEFYHTPNLDGSYTRHGYGEKIVLLGFTSSWWHIQIEEETGYIPSAVASLQQITGNYYDGFSTAVINNPPPQERLNLRTSMSTNSSSLGKYYNGCIVAVLENRTDGWSKVRIGNVDGYMKNKYLAFNDQTKPIVSMMPLVTISNQNGHGVNLRKEATVNSETYALYPNGTSVQVMGLTKEWCHVCVDGLTGFMMTKYLDPQLSYATNTSTSTSNSNSAATSSTAVSQNGTWNGPSGYHAIAEWPIAIAEYTGIVSNPDPADRLHLRTESDRDSKSLGKYYNGVQVIINGDITGEWVAVAIGNLTGYMKTEYLKTDEKDTKSAMPIMKVSNPNFSGNLHLREKQSTKSKSLGLYSNGTEVILMGFNEEWAHVIVEGQIGFMLAKYLE